MTKQEVALNVHYNQPISTVPRLVPVDPDFPAKLSAQMDAFGAHLLIMRGIGKGTIGTHRRIVQKVLREIGTILPTHDQIRQRVVAIYGAARSHSHLVNTIRAIEAYLDFLGNPIRFGRPRKPKHIVKDSLTEAEISVIVSACRNLQEKAVLAVLAYTGIRNQELCDLKVQDVDLARNLVTVLNGKGSKARVVCMAGDCTQVLLEYLAKFPRAVGDYLFTAPRTGRKYSTWAVRLLVKRIVKRTFCRKRVHPHLFRHSLASNMLARGANLLTIQAQLGHADIETTMIYIQSRPQRVQSEYHLFSPSYI